MWKLQENVLSKNDLDVLTNFIQKTSRFTQFEKVKEFEESWSRWQNCKYSVFINSGSSADLLMLDAVKEYYKIKDGAEVLVPAVTWTTNVTSIIQNRLKPVFVDINLSDFSFNYDRLEESITKKSRIILVTHLIGLPANMDVINKIAQKHKLLVLEDCCESHGATYEGTKIGNIGLASTFSFYWGHHMTTVEGGMICTKDEKLRDLFLLKRSHGLARELPNEKHSALKKMYPEIDFNFLFLTNGYNVRNTEFNAVLGINQLPQLDNYIKIRNYNHKIFLKIIEPISNLLFVIDAPGISSFCLPFIFKDVKYKIKLQNILRENNIEFRPIIGGNLLRQPCFKAFGYFKDYPNAEIIHLNGLYIGNNQFVDEKRLSLLSGIVKEIFQ